MFLVAPCRFVDLMNLAGCILERQQSLSGSLGLERVTTRPCQLAVRKGNLSRLCQADQRRAAHANLRPLSTNDDALHPPPCACFFDFEKETVTVRIFAGFGHRADKCG